MSRIDDLRRELSAPLTALQDELGRLIHQYRVLSPLGPTRLRPRSRSEAAAARPAAAWSPAIDLIETPDELFLWADLPGVDPASVELTIIGTELTLRGDKPAATIHGGEARTRERKSGPFHRAITLPCPVNAETVEAEARDGLLRIRLPKAPEVRAHTIPIQTP
ncbi:MAG: Hsp20/alpha crystallin family protein [Isosphaeraceae bacterium]|nr:Hsp20/alpha crystallin family protein [Isosphaeraceae bacterium]